MFDSRAAYNASMLQLLADASETHLPEVHTETRTDAPHGTFADRADYTAQWAVFAIIAAILAGTIARLAVKRFIEDREPGPALRFWSYAGAALALIGGSGHAIFSAIDRGERWLPTFDAVTIIWVGVAIAALLLPDISEFTIAGVSLKRSEIVDLSIAALNDTAELLRNWARSLNALLARFEDVTLTSTEADEELLQFFKLRAYEALESFAGDREERRLSVWLYDQSNDDLFFFFSNEIKDPPTLAHRFPVGRGIVGTVYRDHHTLNERDATALPVYERIRTTPTQYRGILCIPIDYGDARYGVLSIDRQKEQLFDTGDVDVMKALAAIFGAALGNQNARQSAER